MNPIYPVYIISKGRWESRQTSKALEKMNVPYHIVIEPQEYDQYASVVDPTKIKVLPFSNLGKGSIPARNWVWEDSIERGFERHWILDDNIRFFCRLNKNKLHYATNGSTFYACERFVDRYKNVGISGMQYKKFASKKAKMHPLVLNTRVYSCILLDNSISHRWRGRYNEDTDLSLRILKSGSCSVLFNAFLAEKATTLQMKGGNTEELYGKTNNRREFAESLQKQHPDVVKIVWKYNRWHHEVNYKPFKKNRLILKDGITIEDKPNEFGMKLVDTGKR